MSLITGWLLYSIPCGAAIWTAGTSGLWTNPATWGGAGFPSDTDDAIINNAITVTLDNATANLNSLTNNGVLLFYYGWSNTVLNSTWVQINGTVTHMTNTDQVGSPSVYTDWTPDSRVWIVCSNLTVAPAGKLDANGKGYVAKTPTGAGLAGVGPGGGGGTGSDWAGGGGYGGIGGASGVGGKTAGGPTYGSAAEPNDPGSSGGSCYNYDAASKGGNGGGVVRVEATGRVTVNGTITVNGDNGLSNPRTGGSGSGGSIYIKCNSFTGTGVVRASGGTGQSWDANSMTAGGGGGRVAIVYDPTAQSNEVMPSVAFDVSGGVGGAIPFSRSDSGTLYLTDTRFMSSRAVFTNGLALCFRDSTNWISGGLTAMPFGNSHVREATLGRRS